MGLNESFRLEIHIQKQIDKLLKETHFFKDENDAVEKIINMGIEHYLNQIENDMDSKTISFRTQNELNEIREKKWKEKKEAFDQRILDIRSGKKVKVPYLISYKDK